MSDINDISDKVKNMGKDENVMRVDVRVPLNMYERIEVLAERTNQPFTPKTKNTDNPKRIVTPIILKLVELGLKAIDEDSSKLDEDLVTPDIDNSESIENRLFVRLEARLEAKLDELLAVKLNELKADTITLEDNSENEDITPEDNSENEDINPESAIEPNSEIIEVKSEVVNEDVSALEDNSEPKSEIKPYSEAEKLIKKLSKQGKSANEIAKILSEKYYTKRNSTKWSDTQVRRILNPKP